MSEALTFAQRRFVDEVARRLEQAIGKPRPDNRAEQAAAAKRRHDHMTATAELKSLNRSLQETERVLDQVQRERAERFVDEQISRGRVTRDDRDRTIRAFVQDEELTRDVIGERLADPTIQARNFTEPVDDDTYRRQFADRFGGRVEDVL